MNCVNCGCSQEAHIRADGSCLNCPCKGYVDKWSPTDEAPPEPKAPTRSTEKSK